MFASTSIDNRSSRPLRRRSRLEHLRLAILLAALCAVPATALAEGTGDTLDKDWLGVVSKAPGVPTNSAFAGFENNEQVSLYNGNLTIQHPSSPSFPLDGGGSIGLTRVYNSKNVRRDEVHVRDDVEWGYVYEWFPHGQSWAGRGWTMHLGRIFRRPIHNQASGATSGYATYELYFEDASGTEHKLRAAGAPLFGDPQQIAAHPILQHAHHPEVWGVEQVCDPPEFGFCGDECCEYGNCLPNQRPEWELDPTCSCSCEFPPVLLSPEYHEITLPNGTVYHFGFQVAEEPTVVIQTVPEYKEWNKGWIRNNDRAGWYVTWIRDVHGNQIDIEYYGATRNPRFPEAIYAIRTKRAPEAQPTTLIWTEVWDNGEGDGNPDSGFDPAVEGAVRFVHALGANGTTSYEFLFTGVSLADPIGAKSFPVLEEVKLPPASGQGASVGSIRYFTNPSNAPPFGNWMMQRIEYPTGGASEYSWSNYIAGRREGARCTAELLGLDPEGNHNPCVLRVQKRYEVGIVERRVYPEGIGAGKPFSTWKWDREFFGDACGPAATNYFEMTSPDGTIARSAFLGDVCGGDWANGLEGWEAERRIVDANGVEIRLEQFEYAHEGVVPINGSNTALEVMLKKKTVTYGDDTGACFGGAGGGAAKVMTTVSYSRDINNHWLLTRTHGGYLPASRLSYSHYLTSGAQVDDHILDLVDFRFTQEGNQRIEARADYSATGLPTRSIRKAVVTTASGGCVPPDEAASDATWEAWADSLATGCGFTTETAEDLVVCRSFLANGNIDTVKYVTWGDSPTCATSQYGASYESAYAAITSARLDGLPYDSADVTVDAAGFVRNATEPNGLVSNFEYDNLGRLTRIDPPGTTEWPTRVVYPDLKTTRVIRSPGEETDFEASNAAQVFAEDRTDGLGRTIESWKALPDGTRAVKATRFDELGRAIFVSEWIPESAWTGISTATWQGRDRNGVDPPDYEYSVSIPLHSSGRPWGTVTFYGTPDPSDPGNPLKATPDPLGRVRRVEEADGSFTTTEYCGPHSQTTVTGIVTSLDTPSATETATYVHYNNGLGQIVLVDGPSEGADAEYRYDLGGRITRVNLVAQLPANPFAAWKAGTIAAGQERRFVFDAVGRLLEQETPESGISRVAKYDVWGNALETQDALGIERGYFFRNTFDVAGRLVKSEKLLGTPQVPVTVDDTRLSAKGDFNEAADVGAGAWELGTIAGGAFSPGPSEWLRQEYLALGCIPAPPGEASGGAGLYLGSACSYSSAPAGPQAARIPLEGATKDDVLSFKYWRQVRQGLGNRDALEVFLVRQDEGNAVSSKRIAFRQDETQVSYAQWRQTPALRLGDLLAESDWSGEIADVYLYVVFEKGDTETAGLGAGVMVDDVFVGRRAVETLVERVYDVDSCPDALDACSGGEDGTNRYLAKLSRELSYDSGRLVARRDFVYRGLNGRPSGERLLADWAGVGGFETFVSRQTYAPSGTVERVHYPYLPDHDVTRVYEYATRRDLFDGISEIRGDVPIDLVQPGGVSVDFNAAGGISRLAFASGATSWVESDVQYRTHRIHVDGPAAGGGSQTVWDSGVYQYDNRGNIHAIGEQRFAYDLVGRLKAARIVSQANPDTFGEIFRETYSYDLVGNMTEKTWEREGFSGAPAPTGSNLTRSFPSSLATNDNRPTDPVYRFDANGNTLRLRGANDGTNAAIWDPSNRMRAYYNAPPEGGGAPAEVYVYEASGMRLIRYPDSGDGKPVLSIRDASGQLAAEYVVDPALGVPKIWKDFVYGAGQLLVEREVVESVPKLAASSPLSTNSTLGMTLTAGDGSSSYAVDIRTDSGYTNLVTGIVPDAQGKFSIPETAVFPGGTNFLRIRGEGPQPSRYSAAATVAIDPSVDSSSPNQVKWLSVSRSGTQVTVRWQLQQANGKKFKVYFTRADTGQAVLLTQFPLASTSTNITFLDQALASPCGVFTITQTLADGSQETLPSTGAGLPSPGGGDVFGGNQGGCDPDPPPPPGPSGPTWVNTFHHRDHLGSLRVTTDAAGWMISGHDFYPFGMEVAESGQAAGGPSRIKFTGHERDDLTGLDYMKARYSGWFQASFLIPDPANDVNPKNPQSWNRYAYVRNNPMNLVDPQGLATQWSAEPTYPGNRCDWVQSCDDFGVLDRMDDVDRSPKKTKTTTAKPASSNGANKADEANRESEGEDPAAPKAQEPQPPLDPESKFAKFFELNYDAAAEQAAIYNVDVTLLLGVSALESGWGTNRQTREVNNPFGATPDGATPIPFKSIGHAWEYWGRTFGPRVLNVGSDASRFVDNLLLDNRNVYGPTVGGDRRGSYNSVNPDWRPDVLGTIEGVRRRLPRWRRNAE